MPPARRAPTKVVVCQWPQGALPGTRLPLGPRNVWMEEPGPVRVRVEITPVPAAPAPELGARPEEKRAPAAGKGKGG